MDDVRVVCAERKRSGGKVIKICLKIRRNLVKSIVLTGDFFVDQAEEFEAALQELASLNTSVEKTTALVMDILQKRGVRFYGITLEDLMEVLNLAMRQAIESTQ